MACEAAPGYFLFEREDQEIIGFFHERAELETIGYTKYPLLPFLKFETRVVPSSRVLRLLIEKGLMG